MHVLGSQERHLHQHMQLTEELEQKALDGKKIKYRTRANKGRRHYSKHFFSQMVRPLFKSGLNSRKTSYIMVKSFLGLSMPKILNRLKPQMWLMESFYDKLVYYE